MTEPARRPELIHVHRHGADPLTVELRDAETRAEFRAGRTVSGFLVLSIVLVIVAAFAIAALLLAAPRGVPDNVSSEAAVWDRQGLRGAPRPEAETWRPVVPAAAQPAAGIGTPLEVLPDTSTVRSGTASHVGTRFGRRYLALPEHRWGRPGITVRICGPAACVTRTSTDAGPDRAMQRRGRVADLNAWDFVRVCGCSASRGLVRVTVTYDLDAVRSTLPPTETTP
jgi:hypothetical protein